MRQVFFVWDASTYCRTHESQVPFLSVASSVQFSCSVVSDSLRPHESQHTRPPCPSPTPGVHPDSVVPNHYRNKAKKKKKKNPPNFQITAAAAKSLQLCPTLCDPIDGSPSGSPVPGILQARTLEWVAISFSNASWKWKVKVKSLSRVLPLAIADQVVSLVD